jgi:hypothetical protein
MKARDAFVEEHDMTAPLPRCRAPRFAERGSIPNVPMIPRDSRIASGLSEACKAIAIQVTL